MTSRLDLTFAEMAVLVCGLEHPTSKILRRRLRVQPPNKDIERAGIASLRQRHMLVSVEQGVAPHPVVVAPLLAMLMADAWVEAFVKTEARAESIQVFEGAEHRMLFVAPDDGTRMIQVLKTDVPLHTLMAACLSDIIDGSLAAECTLVYEQESAKKRLFLHSDGTGTVTGGTGKRTIAPAEANRLLAQLTAAEPVRMRPAT